VTTTVAGAPFWLTRVRTALGNLVRKHPKTMSTVSIVLTKVGRFVLLPGISACIGGTMLAQQAVQAAGAIAITVGEWLGTALDSAPTAVAQR
jgi:hypothetical protein